jgi:hypothetical protein
MENNIEKKEETTSLIKYDINFLEYPLWMQEENAKKSTSEIFVWQDMEGYLYKSSTKPPTRMDYIFLLYLLMESQKEGWKETIDISRYNIMEGCDIKKNGVYYRRFEESLKRWAGVSIEFKGTFYDGKNYLSIGFHIIDSHKIEGKKVQIRFSPEWLLKIQNSNYFKYINFKLIKSLRSPLVMRLYEILLKTFQKRNKWTIDANKLALKIPINKKYVAHIIPRIIVGVNRISKKTDLKLKLDVIKKSNGKAKFVFYKLNETIELKPKENIQETLNNKKIVILSDEIIELLRPEYQSNVIVISLLNEYYDKYGEEYIKDKIIYANDSSKKYQGFPGYLEKTLKNDWGKGCYAEYLKTFNAIKIYEEEAIKNIERYERLEKAKKEYFSSLNSEQMTNLRQQAINRLSPKDRDNEYLIKNTIETIVVEILTTKKIKK